MVKIVIKEMKKFINTHHMQKSDKKAFDDVIAYSDKVSLKK